MWPELDVRDHDQIFCNEVFGGGGIATTADHCQSAVEEDSLTKMRMRKFKKKGVI